MGLYERLTGIDWTSSMGNRIPNHGFSGSLGEFERGKMTRAQLISGYGLSVSEETELDALTAKIQPVPEAYPMGAYNVLPNVGTAYDTIAPAKGLGFVALDVSGVTQVIVRVRYNKVGSGTLSWQLWNETNSQEVGVFDDAGAAGDNKQNDISVTLAQPLTGGVKLLRVRVKSTTAADDPVYYGSCLFVRRVARLTSFDFEQLITMTQNRVAPLDSIAALKTRLGV